MSEIITILRRSTWLALALLCCMTMPRITAQTFSPPFKAGVPTASAHLDQIYYLQPHNTYLHSSKFTNWLDAGYRAIEIDVIDKDDWTRDPKGPFVSHAYGVDDTNCSAQRKNRLGDCLNAIMDWRRSHSGDQTPLIVFVDMKDALGVGSVWPASKVADLDNFIGRYTPRNITYSYQDLLGYLGSLPGGSYREKLKTKGWPAIQQMPGKMVVLLTGGDFLWVNQNMNEARKLLTQRRNKQSTFFCPDVDSDDPDEISGEIDGINAADSGYFFCANVEAGDHDELVMNRSSEYRQLMHLWGKSGDFSNLDYAYSFIAVAHGTTVVGMDVEEGVTDPNVFRPPWIDSIPYVGLRRSLPGYFMIQTKPSNGSKCVDIKGANFRNDTQIIQSACHDGDNQKFVYTAEGQLRPKGNNKYCLDVRGGKAKQQADMNLWDCDGGSSEKWAVSPQGTFSNRNNDWRFCMDLYQLNPADGAPMKLWPCDPNDPAQIFLLKQVEQWQPDDF